jgi:hypothetical protein
MEQKLKSKLKTFVSRNISDVETEEEMLANRDGLFEKREIMNKTYVTKGGKQLLREQLYK